MHRIPPHVYLGICALCLMVWAWSLITIATAHRPPAMLWQMTVGEYGIGMMGQPQTTTEPSYAELWVGQRQPVLRICALPSSRGAPLSPEDAPRREEQHPITVSLDVAGD